MSRRIGDHVDTSVEQFEVAFGNAEMPLTLVRAVENEAVRVAEGEGRGIIGNEDADGFGVTAEGFTDVHDVVVIPVTEHTFGDGGRRVFPVGKHADFLLSLDECSVELVPRSPGEGNDVHIMVGEQEAVSQCLQGVERGNQGDLGVGETFEYGVGETEKEWVPGGENNDVRVVLVLAEHLVQRDGDVDPEVGLRQVVTHDLVVPFPPGKNVMGGDGRPGLFR